MSEEQIGAIAGAQRRAHEVDELIPLELGERPIHHWIIPGLYAAI